MTSPAVATEIPNDALASGSRPEPQLLPGGDASNIYRGERSGCGDFESLKFDGLPASGREIEEVARLWSRGSAGPASAVQLTGPDASEGAFKSGAPGKRVLHLATHGFFLQGRCPSSLELDAENLPTDDPPPPPLHAENPLLLSGLALAGANHRSAAGTGEEDGILTAEEVAAIDLSGTDWAVLSACDTGVGEVKAGEGVFGLQRASRIAGVRTLIVSLWAVEDEAVRKWMTALYESRFGKGQSTAESVRAAGLTILKERRRKGLDTHPFHWAGFVATGDWR